MNKRSNEHMYHISGDFVPPLAPIQPIGYPQTHCLNSH